MKKKLLVKLIVVALLIALLVVLSSFKDNVAVCEFFATTFARAWIFVFGNILGWIPISFYEMLLIAVFVSIVFTLVLIIYDICKGKWMKLASLVLTCAIVVLSFINIYTSTASFSYNRESLPKEIYTEVKVDEVQYQDVLSMATIVVDKLNAAYEQTDHDEEGNIVYPFTFAELNSRLKEEYKKLPDDYFSSFTPTGKKITNNSIMNELALSGVFFAPFGEPNVAYSKMDIHLPFTLAHEMAHSKGVMRENEANLVAYYVLLTSDDPYLHYSALASAMNSCLRMVIRYPNSLPDYNNLMKTVNSGIRKELSNASKEISQYKLLGNIGNYFNDLYLKLQNQGGTPSYQKPPVVNVTPELDDYGRPIVKIKKFSDVEYMLIHLYYMDLL